VCLTVNYVNIGRDPIGQFKIFIKRYTNIFIFEGKVPVKNLVNHPEPSGTLCRRLISPHCYRPERDTRRNGVRRRPPPLHHCRSESAHERGNGRARTDSTKCQCRELLPIRSFRRREDDRREGRRSRTPAGSPRSPLRLRELLVGLHTERGPRTDLSRPRRRRAPALRLDRAAHRSHHGRPQRS